MNPAVVVMALVGFAGGAVGVVATVMADAAAHSQRQSGLVDATDPGLAGAYFTVTNFVWGIRPLAMFTDWYKPYRFSFIRRCVYVARVGFIVALLFPLALAFDLSGVG